MTRAGRWRGKRTYTRVSDTAADTIGAQVAEPGSKARVWAQHGHESVADGCDDGTDENPGEIVTRGLDQTTRDKSKDDQAKCDGEQMHTAQQSRVTFDDLEEDGQVKVTDEDTAEGEELRQ